MSRKSTSLYWVGTTRPGEISLKPDKSRNAHIEWGIPRNGAYVVRAGRTFDLLAHHRTGELSCETLGLVGHAVLPDVTPPRGDTGRDVKDRSGRVRLAAITNGIEVTLSTDQKAVADDGRRRQGEFVK